MSNTKRKWHEKVNAWIVVNLSALNAFMFLLILLACTVTGGIFGNNYDQVAVGFIFGAVTGFSIGFVYCGLFAIVLTASKDLSRIATAQENQSS